ncbi:metallophosphoesterase [Halobacteriaceae archaeon GCM10025711]
MIAVLSDTHSRSGHELEGRALDAVREADVVVHAGDFITESVLDAFHDESDRLFAVHGNVDESAVRDRLPAARTFEAEGVRFALTHRQDGGETGLAMFGRERAADVVVFGHSHRPTVRDAGDVLLLNPGSHADPRGNPAAHAELTATPRGLRGRIRERDGSVVSEFHVETG